MSKSSERMTCPHCEQELPATQATSADTDRHSAMDFAASSDLAGQRRRRGRTTKTGNLIRLSVLGLCLLLASAAGLSLRWWISPPSSPRTKPHRVFAPAIIPPVADTAVAPVRETESHATEQGTPDDDVSQVLATLERGVVKIESDREGDPGSLGAGFVIDTRGLIATSYHVLSSATRARVRFKNGSVYEVAGYAAIDPELDLAILQLLDPPPNLQAVSLRGREEPPQLTPVVAVGHPHGVEFSTFDGTVSRNVKTSQLPNRSRDFLSKWMPSSIDHRWIQHTARIAEGYSGGPLLNRSGEVIGVNIWVDLQTGTGYALHVDHLNQLRADVLPEIAPLERYADQESRQEMLLQRLSATTLRQLAEDACAMKWQSTSREDYDTLQQLAWAVTYASLPATIAGRSRRGGLSETNLDELLKAAEEVTALLKAEAWSEPGQVLLINEFASGEVHHSGAGLFFFATVLRVVSADDGARAMLMQLAGSDQQLLLPLDGQLIDPAAGSSCLVLGVNYQGQVVRYGDNPLQPIIAPVIISHTILPLKK